MYSKIIFKTAFLMGVASYTHPIQAENAGAKTSKGTRTQTEGLDLRAANVLGGAYASKTLAPNPHVEHKYREHIKLVSKHIYVSIAEIKTIVTFKNTSTSPQNVDIVFAMPPTPYDTSKHCHGGIDPTWDTLRDAYKLLLHVVEYGALIDAYAAMKNAPFLNFQTTDNHGNIYKHQKHHQLISNRYNSKTLTKLLHANRIPLSAQYLHPHKLAYTPLSTDRRLRGALDKLKLMNERGCVNWKNQEFFKSTATIPPGETVTLTHTYRPYVQENQLNLGACPLEACASDGHAVPSCPFSIHVLSSKNKLVSVQSDHTFDGCSDGTYKLDLKNAKIFQGAVIQF